VRGRFLLGLLGILLFGLLVYGLGVRRSLGARIAADRRFLLLSFLAFLASQAVRLVKWRFFFRSGGVRAGLLALAQFYFHIKLLGTLTPGRIGEFLPALASPGRRGPLLSITAYDRLLESLTTILLGLAAFLLLLRASAPSSFLPVSLALLFLIAITALLCYRNSWMMRIGEWVERSRERRGGGGPIGRLLRSERRIVDGIRELQLSFGALFLPGRIAAGILLTLLAVGIDFLFWWTVFRSVGIRLSPGILVASVAVFNVTGFFSPTPGGLGVSDSVFVVFLRSAGVDGPFGSFLILLRLIVALFTAIPAWALALLLRQRGEGSGARGE
jgi:uncharacterized protein (TIRG00374 family)